MNEETYVIGGWIIGILVLIGVWIYALAEWGFLLGIMFGWIPAIIAAVIAGFLWPLIVLLLIMLFVITYW